MYSSSSKTELFDNSKLFEFIKNGPFRYFQVKVDLLEFLEEWLLRDGNIPCDVPREVDHGHDRLVLLDLVPLVSLHRQLVGALSQGAHVPRDVVAPAVGLHPVHAAWGDNSFYGNITP